MKKIDQELRNGRCAGLKTGLLMALLALAVASCSGGGSSVHAQSSSLCVNPAGSGGCYSKIGAAVAAAKPGDTISVEPGTYTEMVTITEPLNLTGNGASGAASIIDATGKAHGIYVVGVNSQPTEIAGFTVRNAQREGILVENSNQVTVMDNIVENNDLGLIQTGTCPSSGACCPGAFPMDQDDCGEALHLRGVTQSAVIGNTVQNNAGGILLSDETGATSNNLIAHNTVQDNSLDCGITLPSHAVCGSGSNDTNGCVGGPEIGKPAYGVFANVVSDNVTQRNGAAGVGLFTPTPGTATYGNLVTNNTILDNGKGGVVFHSHAAGQNLDNNAVIGNIIKGNGGDSDSEGGSSPAPVGIVVFSDGSATPVPAAPLVGIDIAHNTVSDESVDVYVGNKTANNLSIFLNNLLGPSAVTGVQNNGTGTISAMQNYWGCASGPGAPGCSTVSGNVLTSPPLSESYSAGS